VTSLFRALARAGDAEERFTFNDLMAELNFGGLSYPFIQGGGTPGVQGEKVEASFRGYVDGAYKRNGVVFACMLGPDVAVRGGPVPVSGDAVRPARRPVRDR
jgi:hypothetical protein